MKLVFWVVALPFASAIVNPLVAISGNRPNATSLSVLYGAALETRVKSSSTFGICTTAFFVGALLAGVVAFMGARWWYTRKTQSQGEVPEQSQAEETEPSATDAQEAESKEALVPTKEPPQPAQPAFQEYDTILRLFAQQAAQKFGPALAKGQAVRTILEDRVDGFTSKARAMVLNELNGAAANVFEAIDAEEAMLLLDWDNAVAAHFPPMATLLAGLFSPAILGVSLAVFALQILAVLLPIVLLCGWAIYKDWHATCAIPGIFIWLYLQFGVTLMLLLANVMLCIQIRTGQKELAQKREEMHQRLEKITANQGTHSVADMGVTGTRELFICHAVLLQQALMIEDQVRKSKFCFLNGVGTLGWIVLNAWTFVICIGWTFYPGVVAFHPLAEDVAKEHYCGALGTVFVVRLSCVLTVFFFFPNLLTVLRWVADNVVNNLSASSRVLDRAKVVDDNMMGLPLAQLMVKAFFLRGTSEVASAQLAVTMHDKEQLQKDRIETQLRLTQLDSKIQMLDDKAKAMMERPEEFGGVDFLENVKRLEAMQNTNGWAEAGKISVEEAKKKAEAMQEATTEQLERMVNKVMEAVETIRTSEEYQKAVAMGSDYAHQAQDAAQQLKELHDSGELQKGLEQATTQLKEGGSQLHEEVKKRVGSGMSSGS